MKAGLKDQDSGLIDLNCLSFRDTALAEASNSAVPKKSEALIAKLGEGVNLKFSLFNFKASRFTCANYSDFSLFSPIQKICAFRLNT